MNPKLMLLLFGALMLIGAACGDGNSPSGQLSILDKRRIIRSMLDAQKDIRQALKKIRRQIQGDLNSTGHNGAAGDDSSEEDDDDIDEEMGGDGFGDMSGEEEEQHFKEQQKKLRESRERLDAVVKKIAGSLIAVKEYIEKIDKKVDEAIRKSKDKDYTLYFHGKPGHHQGGGERPEQPTTPSYGALARPTTASNNYGYGYGYGYDLTGNFKDALGNFKDFYGQTASDAKTPADDEPYKTFVGTESGKRKKKPNRTYRTRKSLDGTIPTVDTEQLSSPDIPSIVGYEGSVQKTVEFQHNQQQVE